MENSELKLSQPILDQFMAELSRSSDQVKKVRQGYAKMFLDFAGDRPFSEWNKQLVNDFLDNMTKADYASGTIRHAYKIVKRVFDAAKVIHEQERDRLIREVDASKPSAVAEVLKAMALPGPSWDLGKRGAPEVDSEVKPTLSLEEIKAQIGAVKGDTEVASYLSLASIYALRREELCEVNPEHLDFKKKTIYVMTVKGGQRRHQLLCDEIIPILRDYGFKRQFSLSQMSALYHKICYRAGIKPQDGAGWHAYRRALDTELVNLFGQLKAHIFLRWKISSSSLMTERYFSQDPLEIDKYIIYNGHPVVPLWR